MHRRDILKGGLAAGIAGLAPHLASAQTVNYSPMPKGWRTFVLTTRVEPNFATKAWIPLPTFTENDWQKPGTVTWTGNARSAERVRDTSGAEMLKVEWAADLQNPAIEVSTQVQARNRAVTPGQGSAAPLSEEERKHNLVATSLLPVTGLPLPFLSLNASSPMAIAIRLERPARSQLPATGEPCEQAGSVGSAGARLLVLVQLTVHAAAPVLELVWHCDWTVPPSV